MRPRPRPNLRAILQAAVPPEQPHVALEHGFRVRQLDWQDGTANAPYEEAERSRLVWQASTPFGPYRITVARLSRAARGEAEAWYVHRPGARHLGPCRDVRAAKALAQSDFAQRILSAIERAEPQDASGASQV